MLNLENIEKSVGLVAVLLPGFVALGLAEYVSDLRLEEYQFTYVALTLSLIIFAAARLVFALARTAPPYPSCLGKMVKLSSTRFR